VTSARRLLGALAPPACVVAALLAAWHVGVALTGVGEYLLPSPLRVAAVLWEDRQRLLGAAARTAGATLLGFALSAAGGIVVGSLLSLWRFGERGVYPLTLLLQMVPLVAVAPMLSIWFGWGLPSVVAAAVIVSVFPVIASTLAGLRSVDEGHRELFAVLGAGPVATWFKLGLPSALPSIVTGLRIAAGLAVLGALVGERVGAFGGERAPLGAIITSALKQNRTAIVFAAIALAALVGFAVFGVVNVAGWLLLRRWHASAMRSEA
jgi:NitT/TauT family transport system permease protein